MYERAKDLVMQYLPPAVDRSAPSYVHNIENASPSLRIAISPLEPNIKEGKEELSDEDILDPQDIDEMYNFSF